VLVAPRHLGHSFPNGIQQDLMCERLATSTKKCIIVDKKPTTTTAVVVGDGKVFKTRTAAETGMKTIKVCAH
jgi:hypothetical protein